MLTQLIAACCQAYARRGWQTSSGRCPDRSAADWWQTLAAPHALLWARDSARRGYLCTSCHPETPSQHNAKLDFPLKVPRGRPVDSCVCVCVNALCLCGCTFPRLAVSCRVLSQSQRIEAEGEVVLFREVLPVSGLAKPLTPTHPDSPSCSLTGNAMHPLVEWASAAHPLNINTCAGGETSKTGKKSEGERCGRDCVKSSYLCFCLTVRRRKVDYSRLFRAPSKNRQTLEVSAEPNRSEPEYTPSVNTGIYSPQSKPPTTAHEALRLPVAGWI